MVYKWYDFSCQLIGWPWDSFHSWPLPPQIGPIVSPPRGIAFRVFGVKWKSPANFREIGRLVKYLLKFGQIGDLYWKHLIDP